MTVVDRKSPKPDATRRRQLGTVWIVMFMLLMLAFAFWINVPDWH